MIDAEVGLAHMCGAIGANGKEPLSCTLYIRPTKPLKPFLNRVQNGRGLALTGRFRQLLNEPVNFFVLDIETYGVLIPFCSSFLPVDVHPSFQTTQSPF